MQETGTENVVYDWTEAEQAEIRKHVAKYPDPKSAVMPVLWMAQEKFGWLSEGAMRLIGKSLNLSYAHVYGVASFYTMYFKRKVPKYLLDICTCFTCGECGGDDILDYAKKSLDVDENGFSSDGLIWVRAAECLAACDTAPVMQVANRRVVHKLTPDRIDEVVQGLRAGQIPAFESIPLSVQATNGASAAPVATPEPPAAEPEAPAAEAPVAEPPPTEPEPPAAEPVAEAPAAESTVEESPVAGIPAEETPAADENGAAENVADTETKSEDNGST